MNPYQTALEGDQPSAGARNDAPAQQLSANMWDSMRHERPFASQVAADGNGLGQPRGFTQLDFEHGKDLWGRQMAPPSERRAPLPEKTSFNEPFDQAKANNLIQQMGSANNAERDAAAAKITQMGEKAVPTLEDARNQSTNPEIQRRSQTAIDDINKGLERNRSINARQTFRNNDVEWDQLSDYAGKSQLKDQEKSVPGKDEQRRFDKMVKEMDALPDLSSTLENAKERSSKPGAKEGDRAEFQELSDANRAKEGAKLKYAQALSVSKDPADLKKGQEMLTEFLNKSDSKLSENDARSIASLAQTLNADSNPELQKALQRRMGTASATK